jgi:tripartite-type tricarboxylate transporter receptor subunit TctC
MKVTTVAGLAALILACSASQVFAQTQYPTRTVSLVLSQSPGTALDILARLYAEKLSQRLGRPFVVINRPGAGGIIAAQSVATAQPDGYTLLVGNSGHTISGVLNKTLPFDPVGDFAPIAMIGDTPALVIVPRSLGVRTLKEFVDIAKAKPNQFKYASAGVGSATHIAGAYFAYKAGIQIVHIPYKSGADGIADMLGGRVEATFSPAAFVLSLLQDGKLLGIAVSSSTPMKEPMEVPSAVSFGIDYEYSTWYGVLAPAKTPKPVLDILSGAIAEASQDPELQAKLAAQGITQNIKLQADFETHIRAEMRRLSPGPRCDS